MRRARHGSYRDRVISLRQLTKRYGDRVAVNDMTADIRPGLVTGFLGPNGAGKTTTMRMILGLDRPTSGTATVNGVVYRDLEPPLREIGALLDAKALHPGRSARSHLLAMAYSNGLPASRVEDVLEMVGLASVAHNRAGSFSLGMAQRLGIAGALLGDPPVLMFDEPVNGLDPDGVRWIRELARSLANEGRTVFVSSHLMSEMQLMADRLVVLGRGRLLADAPLPEMLAAMPASVLVRSADGVGTGVLHHRLAAAGFRIQPMGDRALLVTGASAAEVGDLARAAGIGLHELREQRASLEETFMELTGQSVEYAASSSSDIDRLTGTGHDHGGRQS